MLLDRPGSYDETKFRKDFPLGKAVAASAAVPGIFQPFPVSRLYRDEKGAEFLVQLSDGGVYDNQGIEALMDEQPVLRNKNCSHLLVSDASGQLNDELNPSTSIANVLSRTNEILMKRVREEELLRLINDQDPVRRVEREARNLSQDCAGKDKVLEEAGKILKPVVFLHLRRNVPVAGYRYIGEKNEKSQAGPPGTQQAEEFGVHPDAQRLLSHIRTDLDTFTDVEALSLAADGYLMAKHCLPRPGRQEWKDWDFLPRPAKANSADTGDADWRFGWAFEKLKDRPHGFYRKQLAASANQIGKVFLLRPITSTLIALPVIGAITALLYFIFRSVPMPVEQLIAVLTSIGRYSLGTAIAWLIIGALAALLLFLLLRRLLPILKGAWNWSSWIRVPVTNLWLKVIGPILGCVFISSLVGIYIITLDRLYLFQGRVQRSR
jgi:NTE family protein